MNNLLQTMLDQLLARLEATEINTDQDPLPAIAQCLELCADTLRQMQDWLMHNSFENTEEEIHFFRNIKPQVDGRLIYYLRLTAIEGRIPQSDDEEKKQYFKNEVHKLRSFYELHAEFYLYHRLSMKHLDRQYFTRTSTPFITFGDEHAIFYESKFAAPKSYVMACIIAYGLLTLHLNQRIWNVTVSATKDRAQQDGPLQWTASKVAIVELIYALYAYGTFNNTRIPVKQIAEYFREVFQVDFGNIYKVYEDIRLRKKNRTPFLSALTSALIKQMEHDDEFAL